jgi:hypothetical protein
VLTATETPAIDVELLFNDTIEGLRVPTLAEAKAEAAEAAAEAEIGT